MADKILHQLDQIDQLAQQYESAPNMVQVEQLQNELKDVQNILVDIITSDKYPDEVRDITQRYGEVSQQVERLNEYALNSTSNPVTRQHLIPPTISISSSRQLNTNVQQLRQTLTSMHQAVLETSDVGQITQEQVIEQREIKDISTLAVNSLKQTLNVQNNNLYAENQRLRDQLEEVLAENNDIKQINVTLRAQLDEAVTVATLGEKNTKTLYEERGRNAEDTERLTADVDRYRSKFENLKVLFDMEQKNSSASRQESIQKLTQLEAEKDALFDANSKMQLRLAELEECDMDSAAIEVKRAAQTIIELNKQIDELKNRIGQQQQVDVDTTQALKATIAAIHEGDTQFIEQTVIQKTQLMDQLKSSRSEIDQLKSRLQNKRK
ncbi:hypothetical protein SS50377_25296 [Spironucleus salmonicida]|uniref:Uncharacterized protein n=1 Tax=Spironucleus salmonicida TaxID=348837 RepID=V6LC63_9EUKA|nr:hypothetical protein SS50377_25296 [Spironucleus salmonicida]|eukprot:EST41823.1 Hypothetical protein SS50377_18657 [Spironucleus salmonicida]